ncbi:hypothetical protein [Demequina aurantiaca]|uniref:hypothetical protein n=1 Tax=Demequina aurantiaca TaxID=676200 RepID=UPI003D351859
MEPPPLADFSSIDAMRGAGFEGFAPLVTLDTSTVPQLPGMYVVVRTALGAPRFLDASVGGWFKGKNPSVPVARLESRWLTTTPVVYIGKAGGSTSAAHLAGRLMQYRRFCNGEPVGHWGGRFICQLADLPDLLVAWRPSRGKAASEDTAAIDEFKVQYGQFPFANLRR